MAFSLEAVFGVDASGVRATMKSLRKDLNDFVGDWAKLGAGVAVGAFVALSKGAVDLAGKLSDTSANLGINVESLQALAAQHKRNGVSEEQFTKALEKTKGAVLSANEGNEKASEALAKLGLRAQDLIRLPLDKQYEAIARGAAAAKDQNEAYTAVAALLGEKVGPKLLGSLRELATVGLPGVTEQARQAGHVMSAETIVALDRAGDAIDDFKRKATIAVGDIIINFRSKEGLQLLLDQFLKVVWQFGAGVLDAIVEAGGMVKAVLGGAFVGVANLFRDGMLSALIFVSEQFNKVIPDFLKNKGFSINVSGLEELKSAGLSVADEITRAIAQTQPSTFKEEIGKLWDQRISDQKKIVEAMNAKDFGADADKLREAGQDAGDAVVRGAAAVAQAGSVAGQEIAAGGDDAADSISAAVQQAAGVAETLAALNKKLGLDYEFQLYGGKYNSEDIQGASDEALKEIIQRAKSEMSMLGGNPGSPFTYGNSISITQAQSEVMRAQGELDLRNKIRAEYERGGSAGVYNANPDVSPLALDNLINEFAKQLTQSERTTQGVEEISDLLKRVMS